MVVQHNLTAMNSNRMLGSTSKIQAKSTEKLSSGYKINRAADDAAGLSISEKMRKQIRGLTQASSNAQDGISAVQTAEGALTEVHDMLQRMNELAVKAANGTNSADDRTYIQNEVDQLVSEIDRVAETTKFNETYLLKGDSSGAYKTATFSHGTGGTGTDIVAANAKTEIASLASGNGVTIDGTAYVYNAIATSATAGFGKTVFNNLNDLANKVSEVGNASATANIASATVDAAGTGLTIYTKEKALNMDLHVGADSADTNKIKFDIDSMDAKGIGVFGLKVDGDSGTKATAAIDTIKEAIQRVSTQRSTLGAVQNRLEHTINNLDNVVENTTSAEASIRDTDMATEMVKYSNNNILAQAGQSMLAQANQSNQGVLALLR